MRFVITFISILLTLSSKADIIGMIKPNVIYAKIENGDTIEMKVEYEQWNYFHTLMGHKWTETYHFSPSGILMYSYGDGNWASMEKMYWKNKYEPLGNDRLIYYKYEYPGKTTTYAESGKYLSYTDTIPITDDKYNLVTLKNIQAYINEHSTAFASRSKAFSGKNEAAEKVFDALVKELKDNVTKKEQPKPKRSHGWIYISGSILLSIFISFFLIRKYRNNQVLKA